MRAFLEVDLSNIVKPSPGSLDGCLRVANVARPGPGVKGLDFSAKDAVDGWDQIEQLVALAAADGSYGSANRAAGQIRTTSNERIYYSILGARAAAERVDGCSRNSTLGTSALVAYDRDWREVLADDLDIGTRLGGASESMSDNRLAALMWLASAGGLLNFIRDRADFDWQGPLVEGIMRHRVIGQPFGAVGSR
jgi:hypothetical protein